MFSTNRPLNGPRWRQRLYEILFESYTDRAKAEGVDRTARAFDIILITTILASVVVVMLDSVESLAERHGFLLHALEWFFTIVFTIEYGARLAAVQSKRRYAFSFFGIVDLFSFIPTYLSLLLPGTRFLTIVRVIRVLRVFRVLKLFSYVSAFRTLGWALSVSRHYIAVFLITVVTLVVVLGSLMYLIEGPSSGFTSIPVSVYWAVVTLTTVGYGDISPQTSVGQLMAALVMLVGYSLIAMSIGIAVLSLVDRREDEGGGPATIWARVCSGCQTEDHDHDAQYCKLCGAMVVDTGHE